MRMFFFLLVVLFAQNSMQAQKIKNGAWYTPSSCAVREINGLAIGLFTGCLKEQVEDRQVINGLDIEILGSGFIFPLAGGYDATGNAFFYKGWEQVEVDTVVVFKTIINGLSLAGIGLAGENLRVNGISVAGLFSMTGKVNGLALGGFLTVKHRMVNGISIGGYFRNESIQIKGIQIGGFFNAAKRVRGVQIGLYNRTKSLKGVQIGLWNKSEKRALPFLNVQF